DQEGLQEEGRKSTPETKTVTDGAGRAAVIDSDSQLVESDTAILSPEGDKFVNVSGVGLVKESHLREQNIIPKGNNPESKIPEDASPWYDGLFDWIPSLEGSGDKSGVVSSGLTHVSEDATEINNSGIEGKEVESHIEVDAF